MNAVLEEAATAAVAAADSVDKPGERVPAGLVAQDRVLGRKPTVLTTDCLEMTAGHGALVRQPCSAANSTSFLMICGLALAHVLKCALIRLRRLIASLLLMGKHPLAKQ